MEPQRRVPRDWENLPSMVMVPVSRGFSFRDLVNSITKQAPEKELVCLVHWGWATSQEQAFHRIQLLYQFADDPGLVLMRFLAPVRGQEQLIIRASFMRKIASEVEESTLFNLTECLSQLARKEGLHTMTVE